ITRAAAIAMALAIGVNLGGEIARLFMKLPVGGGRPARAPGVPPPAPHGPPRGGGRRPGALPPSGPPRADGNG
ncbi:hypothetical protein ACFVUH_28595, partial [Kitasatospora sp. NPDC058032]